MTKKEAIMKKIFVDAALQEAVLYDGDGVDRRYRVSTERMDWVARPTQIARLLGNCE
jgi:hypothetical protein